MERLVLFVLTSVLNGPSVAQYSVPFPLPSVEKSLLSATGILDPLKYPIGKSHLRNIRRIRPVRDTSNSGRWRDLFGYVEDNYSYGNAPISSYTGSVLPFWTFRTNSDFVYGSNDFGPRGRRLPYDTSWRRSGRGQGESNMEIMEAAGTEVHEEEADPKLPRREEEFISEHEVPRDVPTRPKQGVPGGWAKGELPGKKQVDLGFVPVQVYSQIRKYDSEEHLPREKAAEEADNEEELLAAPRLREVLRNKKLHEVYEEEGYEDLGYDHGGYNHQGVKLEGAVKNEHGAYRKLPQSAEDADSKGSIIIRVYSPKEGAPSEDRVDNNNQESKGDNTPEDSTQLDTSTPKVEISGRRLMIDGKKGPTFRHTLKEAIKQNLTIYVPDKANIADRMDIAESRPEDSLEGRVVNNSGQKITFPGKSTRRHYTNLVTPIVVAPDVYLENESIQQPKTVNVHQVASYVPSPHYHETSLQSSQFSSTSPVQLASTINTYASLINQNFSTPLLQNTFTADPVYSPTDEYSWTPVTHHERKVKNGKRENRESETQQEIDRMNEKIDEIKPEGFSHRHKEETTESTRKQSARQPSRRRGNPRGTTTAKSNLDSTTPNSEVISTPTSASINTQIPLTRGSNRKPVNSTPKRDRVYSNFTRGSVKYNPEDDSQRTPSAGTLNIRHPSLPVDTKEDTSDDQKSQKIINQVSENHHQETKRKVDTIHQTSTQSMPPLVINIPSDNPPVVTEDPSANAKYVEQLTLAHYSSPANIYVQQPNINSQDERLKELAKQLNSPQEEEDKSQTHQRQRRSPVIYNKEKYPHYEDPSSISKDSALKYATNPLNVPKKTYGGMEFYESKENIKCRGPTPPKNVTPDKKYEGEWESDPTPDGPRVKNVGNTIECYKMKYFGKDPLDNPFFKEDKIESHDDIDETSQIEESVNSSIDNAETQNHEDEKWNRPSLNVTDSDEDSKSGEEASASVESEEYESREQSDSSEISTQGSGSYYNEDRSPTTQVSYTKQYTVNKNKPTSKPKYQLNNKKKYSPPLMQPITVYSIISSDNIPPHHAPLLIPNTSPNIPPLTSLKTPVVTYTAVENKNSHPQLYQVPNQYIVTKRETNNNNFWSSMNPLKWWWPTMFDSRRDEPRYRRSSDAKLYDVIISNTDRAELASQGSEIVETPVESTQSTSTPLSLAEFKAKFNIVESRKSPETTKKVSTRLTGGFLNRNTETIEHLDLMDGAPSELSSESTISTTTSKPKVIFPRAKIPRLKTFSPKKPTIQPIDVTTEASTTTTTTTLPTTTTTRMYKPKRVIKKNYGRGPFDAFTILKSQRDISTEAPFGNTEIAEITSRSDKLDQDNSKKIQTIKEEIFRTTHLPDEAIMSGKITLPDLPHENDTLTYMVNPVTGVGSWGEQRKWKPKRKRPNTPSIYSLRNITSKKGGASRKKQRDIPDQSQQVYLAGLLSRLPPSGSEHFSHHNNKENLKSIRDRLEDAERGVSSTTRSSKPPPKYILEPDKRRYYYAKVR